MKQALAWLVGLGMILLALFLAASTRTESTSDHPQVGLEFATALRTTPSPTPTLRPTMTPRPTRSAPATPAPTVTPIPDFEKSQRDTFEIWLPQNYSPVALDISNPLGENEEEAAIRDRWIFVYGTDWKPNNFPKAVRSVSIIRLRTDLPIDQVPRSVPDLLRGYSYQMVKRVLLARYEAYQGKLYVTVSGTETIKLFYWISSDDEYWIIIFSAPAAEFYNQLPFFEQSMDSFSILMQN